MSCISLVLNVGIIFTSSTSLYAYLYMLLVNQGYALLAGSMGLFGVLAAVMYLTRNIDWSGEKEAEGVTTA